MYERHPIPDRLTPARAYSSHQCAGCGGRQDKMRANGLIECAYCGSAKGSIGPRIDTTRLESSATEYVNIYTHEPGDSLGSVRITRRPIVPQPQGQPR